MILSLHTKSVLRALAIAATLVASTVVSHAQMAYQVWVDTHSLIANPAAPFSLDFQLNDGSGFGDSNNSATISNIQFGGGSAFGSATTTGNAMGSLSSSVALTDTDPRLNEFYQGFTPGSWLSFKVTLSTHVDSGVTPDVFSFSILDSNLFNLPTTSFGTDTFLEVNIDSATPTIATFASAEGSIAAPFATAVPEASTYGVWAGGLALMAAIVRRRSSLQQVLRAC
jgi:hypothetical protein